MEKQLEEKIIKLETDIEELKERMIILRDNFAYDICLFFNKTKSLKETTEQFLFDNVQECYYTLLNYFDDSEPLEEANDYEECYKDIFNREIDEVSEYNEYSDNEVDIEEA